MTTVTEEQLEELRSNIAYIIFMNDNDLDAAGQAKELLVETLEAIRPDLLDGSKVCRKKVKKNTQGIVEAKIVELLKAGVEKVGYGIFDDHQCDEVSAAVIATVQEHFAELTSEAVEAT